MRTLADELHAAADRIDRMTNAPAERIAVNVKTLYDWAALFKHAAEIVSIEQPQTPSQLDIA
jgi:hypothetical protein